MRVAGVPLMSILGVLTVIQMAAYIVVLARNSALSGPTSFGAMVLLPGLVIGGILFYFAARWFQRRRGLNIAQAFTEIPPE
jgi:hypothetical protein